VAFDAREPFCCPFGGRGRGRGRGRSAGGGDEGGWWNAGFPLSQKTLVFFVVFPSTAALCRTLTHTPAPQGSTARPGRWRAGAGAGVVSRPLPPHPLFCLSRRAPAGARVLSLPLSPAPHGRLTPRDRRGEGRENREGRRPLIDFATTEKKKKAASCPPPLPLSRSPHDFSAPAAAASYRDPTSAQLTTLHTARR
jgi:hypothetical protein